MTNTIENRCNLATACLPEYECRNNLEILHEELLNDIKDANSMIVAMKAVIDKDDARWKFLHSVNQDAGGFEWCILRVKWENGRISEAWQTNSNMSDMDAEIERQSKLLNSFK